MTRRKFYKTVFKWVVLSEEPLADGVTPADLREMTMTGDCSGEFKQDTSKVLDGRRMAAALLAQGSDPEFFQIDEKGDDVCEERCTKR